MPKMARVVAAGVPHHITQRGNNRQDIFLANDDRRFYLHALRKGCRHYGVRVLGYCLMTNHVHLVAVPDSADSFARAFQKIHSVYAQRFNRRYERSGHLWQNRFFSCPLDRNHLPAALKYVEMNPVRAGLVERAEEYAWSSARAHIRSSDVSGLLDGELWRQIPCWKFWAETITQPLTEREEEQLRNATRAGLPVGKDQFVSELELDFARPMRHQKPGPKAPVNEIGVRA